uniref:Guanine nucleotide-binding protein subunit beta-like protein 1 n=1 Tax=Hirondellea gigas TaxID=1518452 RepID=A0A6A7FSS8_9CRUS
MQLKWIEKKTKVSLLVAYESGNICLWDWTNKDLHSVACIDGGTPMSLEYDQCLGSGVIGATHESFFIFTINNSLQISITREIIMRTEGIGSCISRPDSKLYATGGWDNRIRVFTWQKHYSASKVNTHDKTSDGSDDTGSDHLLAAGSLDGKISLWKIY